MGDTSEPDGPAKVIASKVGPLRRLFQSRGESRLAMFFLGFVLALVPGVAGTLWAISYLADNISQLVNVALLALLVASLVGVVLVVLQGRLFRWLGLSVRAKLADVASPVHQAIVAAADGDNTGAADQVRVAAERMASWYSWVSVRRWIVGVLVMLLAGFAALIGTALIHEQNRLIAQQNQYFQRQNAKLETQIRMAAAQSRVVRRSALIATLYERSRCDDPPCPPTASLRARSEAFRALVALDRAEVTFGSDAPTRDYSAVDLRWADLSGLDLRQARLRGADLRGARLQGADLRGADLTNARLSASDLRDVRATGATLIGADLRRSLRWGALLDPEALADAVLEAGVADAVPPRAPVACATCCTAFEAGRAAARVLQNGDPSRADRQDLGDELALMGLRWHPDRTWDVHAPSRLFAHDEVATRLRGRALPLVAPLIRTAPEAVDAFQLGLFLAYAVAHPERRRLLDPESVGRALRGLVGARVAGALGAGPQLTPAGLDAYVDGVAERLGCPSAER